MARWAKPPEPRRLNYNDPITRQLFFALPAGWDRGRSSTNEVTRNTARLPSAGAAMGTVDPTLVPSNQDYGLGLGSTHAGWFNYPTETAVIATGGPFSCAALVRPLIVPALNTVNRRILQKRLDGQPTSPGFDLFVDSFVALTWTFEWSDGVNEERVRSGLVPSAQRTDLLVGTLNPTTGTARLYINGALETAGALTVFPVNPPAQPIGVSGGIGPAGDEGGDNAVGMAAIWARELSAREVSELWADPFRMWRG